MTDQPTTLAREAKSFHQSLKELLKTKEPFDREVDFQRKNLRRRYLNLLLTYPYAKESKDVETHLWMQTSHAFISIYRQRILTIDRLIQNKANRQPPPGQRQADTHTVERRKLVSRFQQFLADEEKFWSQLLARLRRSFSLDEATPALVVLEILSKTEENPVNLPESSDSREGPPAQSNGRNHFQFPPEDTSISVVPTSATEREGKLAIVSKALICLGDIARYRELYKEGGGRSRAGHEDLGPPRRGRNRRGGQITIDSIPRPRDYSRAQQCYVQARLLVPHEGNPSHQLAILASYQKDSFESLVHYYRALCVRQPYETAAENLANVLAKAMEQWRNRSRRERERTMELSSLPPRVRIEHFKEKVVVMHALWKVGMEKGVKKMNSISHDHPRGVRSDFYTLVSERHLPIEMISNTIVLSQGALWKHRMIRDNSSLQNRKSDSVIPSEGTSKIIEWGILNHLFDLHCALLEVGKDELGVPPPVDAAKNDLAQRITATFRRTLPALRLASKWIRANYKYVSQDLEFTAYQENKHEEGKEIVKTTSHQISRYSYNTREFWETYTNFIRALTLAFPVGELPPLTAPLDEDIEMRGFLPLKDMMSDTKNIGEKSTSSPGLTQAAHPNDWQLMRIAELINDAKALASLKDSPIIEYKGKGHILFDADAVEPHPHGLPTHEHEEATLPAYQNSLFNTIRDSQEKQDQEYDSLTEVTSPTDDDDVGLLRDAVNVRMYAGDDDEIVWDPRGPASPIVAPTLPSPTSHTTPATPVKTITSPLRSPAKSPTHSKITSPFQTSNASATITTTHNAPMTAQDLTNDLMSGRAITGALSHLESSVAPPTLLFGPSHQQGQNIWSASHDEQSLKFTSQPNQTYQARQYHSSTAPDLSQTIWSSSYTPSTQDSQHHLAGALPSSPYAQEHRNVAHGGHQRMSSLPLGPSQAYSNYYPTHPDPFTHTASVPQQPIHRPEAHGHILPTYMNSPLVHGGPGMYYESPPEYHTRHLSQHDPRLRQSYAPPSMSQHWGNAG
ncbi:hypothetical protein BDZ94DRAFT_60469 [Collybia nuda]|uniref:Protein SMG7 n=1 Tax=Collybia nuda TaxID=64659 RepID=A0A9P5YET3_9AGAR|nr:hypothetical protein BDZ94DRAFT_60469 [Collybia nuda]